jgi:hypothetical protein
MGMDAAKFDTFEFQSIQNIVKGLYLFVKNIINKCSYLLSNIEFFFCISLVCFFAPDWKRSTLFLYLLSQLNDPFSFKMIRSARYGDSDGTIM